jgi:hypothetical protein
VQYRVFLTLRGGFDDVLEVTDTSEDEEDGDREDEYGEDTQGQAKMMESGQTQLGGEIDGNGNKKVSRHQFIEY